ncbi:MAG: SOS response-associated peptidase [Solirubrobacteraceae bacterium]
MCGRYTLATPDPGQLRARFPVGDSAAIRRRYNVAPGDDVLAVTIGLDLAPRGELLRWGLVPAWAKSPEIGLKLINARTETVTEKSAFRTAFARMRCLILADGFYEWRRLASGRKQAFHVTRPDREPFAFAGLWSVWNGAPQADAAVATQIRSCAIMTAAARGAIASLHDRMPVILTRGAEEVWLDNQAPELLLNELIGDCTEQALSLRAVGPAVNDARYDGPDCLSDPVPDRQSALF